MDIAQKFLEQAKKQKRKIAITILRPIPETLESLKRASKFADLIVVGVKVDGFENIIEEDPDKASQILIGLLKDKKVDGIVRGQVKDSFTLDEFHRQFGKEPLPSNRKVAISVMQKDDYTFVISTGSVYQGLTLEDKIYEVEKMIRYMKENLEIEPKIAVMGILRPTSKRGKYKILDEITEQCTKFYEYLVDKGYDAKEYYMEYETAVWEGRNFIVPSTGLIGNSWLKALLYLGGWNLLACAYLDLGVVYEDGTRNEKDFFWHIVHAVAMANSKK
jgi:predicted methyltransferase MtxX (methanogen marker protein 4)